MILRKWTRVRTFLTPLFQVVYLVVHLGIRLPLLASSVLEKLFSLAVIKTSDGPDGIAYFDTESLLTSLFFAAVELN